MPGCVRSLCNIVDMFSNGVPFLPSASFLQHGAEVYGPYLDTMLKLLLTRYESSKTDKYACCLVVFTSVMMAQHGADHVIVAMEAIQAGLFAEFMTGIYLPHVQKVKVRQSPTQLLFFGGRWWVGVEGKRFLGDGAQFCRSLTPVSVALLHLDGFGRVKRAVVECTFHPLFPPRCALGRRWLIARFAAWPW